SIMVIENDEGFQFYIKFVLQRDFPDVSVVQAHDGGEALDYLNNSDNQDPDIILLDLNMFGVNGFEFLDEWKENHMDKKTQIFVLTSSDDEDDRKKVKSYSFVKDYLLKPIDESDLRTLLAA
ncbi:MAG: response regulator, partial [Bdellovibrionales bacterium]